MRPSQLTIRSPRLDEAEAAAELLSKHSRRIHGQPDTTPESLRWYWEAPDVDLERDVFVAESFEGELVGYADLGTWGDAIWIDLRGLDAAALEPLLEAAEQRADQRKGGKAIRSWANEQDTELRELYEGAGYQLIRHSFRMEIELAEDPPEPEWPQGIAIRNFRPGDERRLYDAHMAAFADTWAFSVEPYDEWEHFVVKGPDFHPELYFLAESGPELVGVSLCQPSDSDPDMGWVNLLGVVPAWRRRGLAIALLRHSFREFRRRGFSRGGLGVDAENPTGAVRLYERAGMHVARTSLQYERARKG